MKNLKDKVKKEFESQIDVDLHFDTSNLEPNSKPSVRKNVIIHRTILATISVGAICLVSIPIIKSMESKETFKQFKKQYTQSELKQIELDSFKKLNEINYPESNEKRKVSDEYHDSVIEFSNRIYSSMNKENISFSPLNLHMNLSILSLASDNELTLQALDNLLGMNKISREQDFINAYINDYFYNNNGTIQMYNGYFATNKYESNTDFISSLTRHYTEAYQVDFNSDQSVNKILKWVDQKVQDKNFLNKKNLDIKEDTAFLLMSTLYFKNSWRNTFNAQDTSDDVFYLENGSKINVSYLFHSYYGDCYDYEEYISCYDYYENGLKIKYLIPKTDVSNSIFELIQNANIFKDDETRRIKSETGHSWNDNPIVKLKAPKFESECMIDFSPILKDNGLEYLFDEMGKSFNYAFDNLPIDHSICLDYVKQKNRISFDEDGTTIKSISFAMGGDKATATAPMIADTIEVNLNRPFIYVIYDSNDLPIFVGNVNNPKK